MKNLNYYVIHGWMLNELQLKGNDLLVYAIIYGFSQDGESRFSGSSKYLQKCTRTSQPTVLKSLKFLVENQFIIKHRKQVNGVLLNDYSVSKETLVVLKKLVWGTKESLRGGTKESLVHIYSKDNNKDITLSEHKDSDGENISKNSLPNGKPTIQERSNQFLPLADYLCKIISSKKNIKYNARQIKSWAEEIRKLSEINDISPIRIKRALRWYKMNIGGEYIPVIESGHSLRMKFLNLEAAKEREENGFSKSESKVDPDQLAREERIWMAKFGQGE